METIKAIFVGCGEIAQVMMDRLARTDWCTPAAVVDIDLKARQRSASALGLPAQAACSGLESALAYAGGAVVIINTPAELHAGQARIALLNERNVLVAKPLATEYAQAAELVELARSRGLRLNVAEQMRYQRHFRALCAFLASGALGRIEIVHFLNSKPRPQVRNLDRMRQPTLLEMSSHHFDLLMALFPQHPPEWVMFDGFQPSWSGYAGPCMLHGLLRMHGNIHVLYQAGYSSQAPCYELRLEGTRGTLRCHGLHMSLPAMTYEFAPPGQGFAPIDLEAQVQAGDAWAILCDEWRAALTTQAEVPFSGANNLKLLALIAAAERSIESGLPCRLGEQAVLAQAFEMGHEWIDRP
jgi:predicted dehydrogenase